MNEVFSSFLDWMKKLWLPISGFIAIVVTIYQFIQLWKGDIKVFTFIVFSLGISVILLWLVFVGYSKIGSPIVPERTILRYPQHARIARIGIYLILICLCVGIGSFQINREKIGQVEIVIAEFDSRYATKLYEVASRIEDKLRSDLDSNDLDYVVVNRTNAIIHTSDEASALASRNKSKIIIWGRYDDLGIKVYMTILDKKSSDVVPSISELPFKSEDIDNQEVAFVIQELLPENISFLSLFAIGHIYYFENKYEEGHKVLDAAMGIMPSQVVIENEAVLHFFTARQLEDSDSNIAEAICEYTEATKLDKNFAEAYNNVGVLLARFYLPDSGFVLTDQIRECISKVSNRSDAISFYEKALEIKPDWALPKYNIALFHWRYQLYDNETVDVIETSLKDVVDKDPSIADAYAVLGNISFGKGDLINAESYYLEHLKSKPDSTSVHFNLGEVYLRRNENEKARSWFSAVLKIANGDPDATLALTVMNNEDISLGNVIQGSTPNSTINMSVILKSRSYFNAGKYKPAIEQINSTIKSYHYQEYYTIPLLLRENGASSAQIEFAEQASSYNVIPPFENYLIALLYAASGDTKQADHYFAQAATGSQQISAIRDTTFLSKNVVQNMTTSLAWDEIVTKCAGFDDPATWGTTSAPCLPTDKSERINTVYDIFQDKIKFRLHYLFGYSSGGAAGMCPYVYTYDDVDGMWKLDTTILYKINNRDLERTQMRQLSRFDGKVLLREVEPETSFIDMLHVIITYSDGNTIMLFPDTSALLEDDGRYLVLNTGDEILVTFEEFDADNIKRVDIVANGYYIPYPP